MFFDDKSYARVEDLSAILKPRHDADPKYRAVIRGDENVPRRGNFARDERLRRGGHLGHRVFPR